MTTEKKEKNNKKTEKSIATSVKRIPATQIKEEGKVHILIYDSSKDDSAKITELETALEKIYFDEERFELISFDKTITPSGCFIMVLIYKELNEDCLPVIEDDEIIVGLDTEV